MATELEIRESVLNLIGNMTVNEFIEELENRNKLAKQHKSVVSASLSLYEEKFNELK